MIPHMHFCLVLSYNNSNWDDFILRVVINATEEILHNFAIIYIFSAIYIMIFIINLICNLVTFENTFSGAILNLLTKLKMCISSKFRALQGHPIVQRFTSGFAQSSLKLSSFRVDKISNKCILEINTILCVRLNTWYVSQTVNDI